MEDDVMKLGITLFVCCTVQTDKPSGQTLIQELSAITVCTLDSCLTVNTTKPAGLSRKWQWHMGLLSASQLSCFWQRCPLPLFHRDKKLLDDKGSWSLWKHIMQSIICGCGSAFFANKVERQKCSNHQPNSIIPLPESCIYWTSNRLLIDITVNIQL